MSSTPEVHTDNPVRSARPVLRALNISKTFPGQRALDQVDFEVRRGEVLALVGQNGCGKSTLIKVLTGFHDPDAGASFEVDGEDAHLTVEGAVSTSGVRLEIRAVHQHLGLVEDLSVMDNVAMVAGYVRRSGRVDWAAQERLTRKLLDTVGATGTDPFATVGSISPLERTQIAIARVMSGWEAQAGMLILDEPTASLPAEQSEDLFAIVRRLRDAGVAIVYVSHRLEELVALADRVTVLRDGRLVAHQSMEGVDKDDLVTLMLGHEAAERARAVTRRLHAVDAVDPHEAAAAGGVPPALRVRNLSGGALRSLDLELAPGEIVGFTGLVGSGQEVLPYLLCGAARATSGTATIDGRDVDLTKISPAAARDLGVVLVPADRAAEAVVPQFDITRNMTLPALRRFRRRTAMSQDAERAHALHWIDRLAIAPGDPDQLVTQLSGGNAQKVVLARWLTLASTALLLAEPTAGVDIGAKALIYEHLRREAREQNLSVLVSSTDTLDLVQLCTRVVVLSGGVVVDEITGSDIDEDTINHRVLSASEAAS